MRWVIRLSFLGGLWLAAGSGCTSESAANEPQGPSPWRDVAGLSADVNTYFEAFCARAVRCGVDTWAACQAQGVGTYCEPGFADVVLPELDRCVQAMDEHACDAGVITECFAVRKQMRDTRGYYTLVQVGEACDDRTRRCDFDAYCSADAASCGECLPVKSVGAACIDSEECETSWCREGVCAGSLQPGAVCSAADWCVGGSCENGRCVEGPPPGDPGDACTVNTDCAYSLYCVSGTCVAPSACGTGQLDEACRYDGSCAAGLVCDMAIRRCADPTSALDVLCDIDGHVPCELNTYCHIEPGEVEGGCRPRIATGEACPWPGSETGGCEAFYCNEAGLCDELPPLCTP